MLNRKHEFHLGFEEVLYGHTLKRHNLRKYYLVVDAKPLHQVTNLLNTSKHKPQGNVLLFGAWGCVRDPMLQEFLVNTNPAARRAQESAFSLSGLNDPSLTLFVHV